MPDYIGNVPVPEIAPSGIFPLVPDYPYGIARAPEVVIHAFGSGNAKIEQRFLLGTGTRQFTVRKAWLRDSERIALRNFWETKYGPYGAFTYNAPNADGTGTSPVICRFANEPLSWEMVSEWACSLGVTLIEIPATTPTYPLNQTVHRFPPAALQTALLSQVQEIIPLVRIQPLEPGYPAIHLSDRRCIIGSQLYQARILELEGISQGMGNESDEAQFRFGNADRVMHALANDVDLFRAELAFSLFHVGTGIELDLWKGNIVNWAADSGPEFRVTAADGLYELNLPYPTRRISRTCWKAFDSTACPFASHGSLDLMQFPSASPSSCDKGFDTPNGCRAHGMGNFYGGIVAKPQGVRIKDNSTGVWGFGRSTLTSVSLIADSIYDQVLPEIYTDSPMPVNAKIASGRDESDFYAALGIVGEGPLGGYGSGHKLDGQYHHGYPGSLGLMATLGGDPNPTPFGMDTDPSVERAAGTAFMMLRRADSKGLQLTRISEHTMEVTVALGLAGWTWSSPGLRFWGSPLTNPIWIAINMLLRARGIRLGMVTTAQQLDFAETLFDVNAAAAAAAVCDLPAAKLVGEGTETQFRFRGVLQEEKPLRDWLQEVLMNCLGYYTFANGKLKLGVRVNSSVAEAFTEGNILFRSLQLTPLRPAFNHLTANFADEEFEYVANAVSLYDMDHAMLVGGAGGPLFLKSTVNLAGTSSKSQAARIITCRLREEMGGITPEEWKRARRLSFKTTVLALNTEPGMVCSMTHPDMPGGSGEFRVTSWRLNPDYSIDIEGRTTTDSMYDLVSGPKPADVPASPVPGEPGWDFAAPPAPLFGVSSLDGILLFGAVGFEDLTNTKTIAALTFTVWHFDETAFFTTTLSVTITDADTALTGTDLTAFGDGDLALLGSEIVKLVSVDGNTATIERAQKGSTAAMHDAGVKLIRLDRRLFVYNVPKNFYGTPESGSWEAREPFRSMAVCAVELYATNFHGNSPVTTNNYTSTLIDGRLRILSGEQVDLIVEGIIGIESDAVPAVYLRQPASIRDIYAYCRTAPQDGNITAVVKVNGNPVATVTINDGQNFPANTVDGKDLPAILPTEPITLDVTGVGLTYPGERLVVTIRF
jgi:hypothetical protein